MYYNYFRCQLYVPFADFSLYESTGPLLDDGFIIRRLSIIARDETERDIYADYQSPGTWRQSRPSVSAARSTAIPAGSWHRSPATPLACPPRSIPSSIRLGPRGKLSVTTAVNLCFRVGTGAGTVVSIATQVSI